MKDQYVGDVSDYLKYAMLRSWANAGLTIGLAWMLTEADLRSDGALTGYLGKPGDYRDFDPELFDGLRKIVAEGRSIQAVVERGLLHPAISHDQLLEDDKVARDAWFANLGVAAIGTQMLFFDPDNGLEVASVARGGKGSRRYLYLDELRQFYAPERGVCVYQHFPRVSRRAYLDAQLRRLAAVWPGAASFAICSSRIALLVSAPRVIASDVVAAAAETADRGQESLGVWRYAPHA